MGDAAASFAPLLSVLSGIVRARIGILDCAAQGVTQAGPALVAGRLLERRWPAES